MRFLFNISAILLLSLSSISCVSWSDIRDCHNHVRIGETTACAVKRECGRPIASYRDEDNTVTYFYSQEYFNKDTSSVREIVQFHFSPDGKCLSSCKYSSDDILPWTYDDPFTCLWWGIFLRTEYRSGFHR